MKRWMAASAGLALAMGGAAQAQQTIWWPAPVAAAQQQRMSYFPTGTPLMLVTRTVVSTKDNKPGDPLYLYVAEGLSYHGQVVVPAGAVAIGEVGQSDRNGHVGRKGRLAIHLLSIETPSGPVRLGGGAGDEGTSGLAVSIATMALVSPLGFFIHGTSAHLPAGTMVQAYLAEPLRFVERPGAPAVMGAQVRPDAGGTAVAAR